MPERVTVRVEMQAWQVERLREEADRLLISPDYLLGRLLDAVQWDQVVAEIRWETRGRPIVDVHLPDLPQK